MRAMDWFTTKELEPGIHLISEPPHVNSYLIVGRHRAILFDTGMAFVNIREVVEELTDRPVLVVNSHYHFDHVGGNHLFDEIAIHEAGAEPLGEEVPRAWLDAYVEFTGQLLESYALYRDLDDRFFRLLTTQMYAKPLPAGFDWNTWKVIPTVPSRALFEGDVLDVGDRAFRVLHTPGHTPDCICLLDESSGTLLAGDTLVSGPLYAHLPDSDIDAFARSTARLATEVRSKIRVIYPAHIMRIGLDAVFLTEVADGFQAVISGLAHPKDGTDIFGGAVTEFWFDRFSIVLPHGWRVDPR